MEERTVETLEPVDGETADACSFCHQATPPFPEGRECHAACAEAYGLDYNPQSDADARIWLDNRRRRMGLQPHWTNRAYAAVVNPDGFAVGLAEAGQPGYYPAPEHGSFPSWEEASAAAKGLNRQLGLSDEEAIRIVISSMGKKSRGSRH